MSAKAVLPRLLWVLMLVVLLGLGPGIGPGWADAMDSVDSDGLKTMVERGRGKVVLVNFWASWCGPCRKEMPHLIKLRETLGEGDLLMIGVALDFDAQSAANYAQQAGLNFPTFHAREDVMPAFAVQAIPKTMVWDREGILRIEHVGLMAPKALFEGIGALLGQ
ncbi:MAG: TlpA family protein disulfide reductase [Proteobacteria bacterium]|nr:TlpA family protein disulfide reductase [Pseudomonadota bacterium]